MNENVAVASFFSFFYVSSLSFNMLKQSGLKKKAESGRFL